MATIFISYRRADSADISGRIYDRLTERFGREHVFKDVDSIPPGVNFPDYIAESIEASDIALIIIGPRWLEASAGFAQRRLDDPADFVRVEIETALRLGITVIPVLVGGARMPAERRLPASLRPLLQQNGLQVRQDPDFSRDMERVCAAIEYWQRQPRRAPVPPPETTSASVAATDLLAATITPAPEPTEQVAEVARPLKVATALAEPIDDAPTRAHKPVRPLAPILIAVAALLVIAVSATMLFSGKWEQIVDPAGYQATQTANASWTQTVSAMPALGRMLNATWTAQANAVAAGYTPSQGIGPCAAPSETFTTSQPYYWEALNPKLASCSPNKQVVTFNENDKQTSGATYHGRPGNIGFPASFTASFTIVFVTGASPVCATVSAYFESDPFTVPAPKGRVIDICGNGSWKDDWDNDSPWKNFASPNTPVRVSIYVSQDHVIFTVNGTQLTDEPGNPELFKQLTIQSSWISAGYDHSGNSIEVSNFTIVSS